MILSCVKRIHDKLGYWVGVNLVGQTLRGSRDKRVLELGLDGLSTYGLLKDRTRSQIHGMIDHLEANGYLQSEQEFQTIFLTPQASQVLFQGKKVLQKIAVEPEQPTQSPAGSKLYGEDAELFEVLKELRMKLARQAAVPAFVIFSNATLSDMAKKKPQTLSQFKKVSGVGEIKAAWYGEAFLERIREYLEDEKEG